MKATDVLRQLGRPVAYYPNLVKQFKSVTATVLFCQFFYWHDKAHSELGIYKTTEEITEETGLTYKEQLTARKQLIALGVLSETNKRLEHRIYYKINLDRVNELLENTIENSPYSQTAFGENPIGNFGNNSLGSSLYTENTSENTTDIFNTDKSVFVDDKKIAQLDDDCSEENIPNTIQPKNKKQNTPNCPYQKIVELYEEILPELPRVAILTEKRKRYLNARWREHKNHQSLAFWEDYFKFVRKSQFLLGNSIPKERSKSFKADFEWLISPNNFVKVVEGKYV
ncbi:hypothetical protein MTZ49_07090 [Entomomonas sp. E2T0]|uniref:hypothetical protein n=1 Tax=Entomomonas sp. E2T0 TaxID=2930213 RepID=UPI0022281C12|nr:hypothetical protein [Entomomonas sp. E2T0]UYZ85303.1 hypothetical protein MTZ49_07090 [Entomomonas sp. E2T0]